MQGKNYTSGEFQKRLLGEKRQRQTEESTLGCKKVIRLFSIPLIFMISCSLKACFFFTISTMYNTCGLYK